MISEVEFNEMFFGKQVEKISEYISSKKDFKEYLVEIVKEFNEAIKITNFKDILIDQKKSRIIIDNDNCKIKMIHPIKNRTITFGYNNNEMDLYVDYGKELSSFIIADSIKHGVKLVEAILNEGIIEIHQGKYILGTIIKDKEGNNLDNNVSLPWSLRYHISRKSGKLASPIKKIISWN